MTILSVNHQLKRIEVKEFEIGNEIIFNYFNGILVSERETKFLKAIYIGVLALMEDRISSFLAKTSNELGTELESLKMIFDMKKEIFYKSSIKGSLAEEEIANVLNKHFEERKLKDKANLTRNIPGNISKNKTGDLVCEIEGKPDVKIVIECKFDKSLKLGEIETKDIFTKKADTAWSQLLEAEANRDAKVSLIVFDVSLVDSSILKYYENVGYIPSIGFVAIINSQKGDYSNLFIAYMLARDIALKVKNIEFDKELLAIIINRIIKDIHDILSIKTMVEVNIDNNKNILKQLEKSILTMQFNQEYLSKFLKDGIFTKKDMLSFYSGEDIKDKYRVIEKEIENI